MKTGHLRHASFTLGIILALLFLSARECPAQSVIPPIEISQEELEKYTKRLDLSQLSTEDAMGLLGIMSKAKEGFASPGSTPGIPPGAGISPPATSVFPQVPPAVAGTREALGRWMMFQAELLSKLAKSYAAYGGELLQQSSQGTSPKPATQTKGK
jgi:hypothetical protein